jgi:hypothetical protein
MVALAGHIARPGSAEACSVAPDSITVHDTPVNGVVVIDVGCSFGNCFDSELPDELPVMDKTTGEMVPGSIVYTTGSIDTYARLAWKPDAPLVAGHTYEMMWQPEATLGSAELDYELLALPAATWQVDEIVVDARTWLNEASSEWVACEVSNGGMLCGPNDGETYTVQNGLDTALSVGLQAAIDSAASPAESVGQFLVKAALWGEGEEQPELSDVPGYVYSSISIQENFETAFDAYCYRVEVTSLIDGAVAISEDCLPHTYGELTIAPLSDAEIATQLGWCVAPPDGYDDLWCTGRRPRCEEAARSSWDEPGCDTLEEQCRDVLDPMDPSEPPGGDGDGNDDAEAEMMNAETGLEGGCSALSDRRTGAWPGLLFAAIFLAVRARRARKSA